MKLLKILFVLTCITLPLGQVARLQLPGDINFSLFDISVLLLSSVWIIRAITGKSSYRSYTLSAPILLFFLTILLSLVTNLFRYPPHDLAVAFLYGIRWLVFACVYFVIRGFDTEYKAKVRIMLTISGAVVVLFGFIQYVFYANLRNLYYLGWDEHLVRMFSTLLDPNFLGAFLVLLLLFFLGQLVPGQISERVTKASSVNILPTIALTLLSVATFISIFLTTSRSAFLMLLVSLITYFSLIGKKKWLLVFALCIGAILIFSSRFFYIENINPFRIASSLARVESGINALTIISKNPIFGVGFNAYRYAQYEYGFRTPQTEYPNHADSGTDNSYLFVFATSGLIGLVSYGYILWSLYRIGETKHHSPYRIILLSSLIGLMVDSLFINSLFYPLLMYWVWVVAGLTDYT